jgi:hypothetical protein
MYNDVSEQPATWINSVDDKHSQSLSFVSTLVPDYATSHPSDMSVHVYQTTQCHILLICQYTCTRLHEVTFFWYVSTVVPNYTRSHSSNMSVHLYQTAWSHIILICHYTCTRLHEVTFFWYVSTLVPNYTTSHPIDTSSQIYHEELK